MFPSLTLFSDLNWDIVTKEYQTHYADLSFPEYLQQKALDGDCPDYLFELAFYELALIETKNLANELPLPPGVHLNPTALFLNLEFDVKKMLKEASEGKINVHERSHVLCIFRDSHDFIHELEIKQDELELLQMLEDGPQRTEAFLDSRLDPPFKKFISLGLIMSR
jgi:hypothetical protein